jgi:hypothetical protein
MQFFYEYELPKTMGLEARLMRNDGLTVSITLNQMREEFRSSREKRYHTHPKTCALLEHEYDVPIADDDWKKTADNMEQCLRNFYASETFAMLRDLPGECGWRLRIFHLLI